MHRDHRRCAAAAGALTCTLAWLSWRADEATSSQRALRKWPAAAHVLPMHMPRLTRSCSVVGVSSEPGGQPGHLRAGEPTGEPKNRVGQVISQAKSLGANSQYGPGAIAFEFAQARAFSVTLLLCAVTSASWACAEQRPDVTTSSWPEPLLMLCRPSHPLLRHS